MNVLNNFEFITTYFFNMNSTPKNITIISLSSVLKKTNSFFHIS